MTFFSEEERAQVWRTALVDCRVVTSMQSAAAAAKGRKRGPTVTEKRLQAEVREQNAALAKEQESCRHARGRAKVNTVAVLEAGDGAQSLPLACAPMQASSTRTPGASDGTGGAGAAGLLVTTHTNTDAPDDGDRAREHLVMQGKKKQKLLEKTKSRSWNAVMAKNPVGVAQVGTQPRLEDFAVAGRSPDAVMDMHAVAMREWCAANLSKKALQGATKVRPASKHRPLAQLVVGLGSERGAGRPECN